jgi:hypothetical protein
MTMDNSNTQRIGAGDQGSINIVETNMPAHVTNIDEANPLTAALDC